MADQEWGENENKTGSGKSVKRDSKENGGCFIIQL